MNIPLPAILGFTRYHGFDPSPYDLMGFSGILIMETGDSMRVRQPRYAEILHLLIHVIPIGEYE